MTLLDYSLLGGLKNELAKKLPPDILYCNGDELRQSLLLQRLALAELQFFKFIADKVVAANKQRWTRKQRQEVGHVD